MNGYLQNGDYNSNSMDGNSNQYANSAMMMGMGQESVAGGMMGGQSLDEIVNENAKVSRRQSMPQQYGDQQNRPDANMRRVSMMEYGGNSPAASMGDFQYGPNAGMNQRGMMPGNATQNQQQHNSSRHQSNADLSLQTSFPSAAQNFNPMMQPAPAYQSPAHPQSSYDMTMNSPYIDTSMGMQMDYNVDQGLASSTPASARPMNVYNQPQQFGQGMMQQSPIHYGGSQTPLSARPAPQDPGGGSRNNSYPSSQGQTANAAQALSRRQSLQNSAQTSPAHGAMSPSVQQPISTGPPNQQMRSFSGPMPQAAAAPPQDQEIGAPPRQSFDGLNGPVPVNPTNWDPNNQRFNWETPEGGWPSTLTGRPHMQTTYKNAYSATGFDMLGVLVRVQ